MAQRWIAECRICNFGIENKEGQIAGSDWLRGNCQTRAGASYRPEGPLTTEGASLPPAPRLWRAKCDAREQRPSPRRETTSIASEGASLATPGNGPGFAEVSSPRSSNLTIEDSVFGTHWEKHLCTGASYYNLLMKSYDISRIGSIHRISPRLRPRRQPS